MTLYEALDLLQREAFEVRPIDSDSSLEAQAILGTSTVMVRTDEGRWKVAYEFALPS